MFTGWGQWLKIPLWVVQTAILPVSLCSACAGLKQWAGCSWAKGEISKLIKLFKKKSENRCSLHCVGFNRSARIIWCGSASPRISCAVIVHSTFLFIIWWLLAGKRDQNLNITLFNTNTGNLPHVELLNPCALKGRCVQGLILYRRSKRAPYSATRSTLHYVYMPCAPGSVVGIEGFTYGRGWSGRRTCEKWNARNRIKSSSVQIEAFGGWVFRTRWDSAERNRPPPSLDVRTAAEKQPTCQSTWTDIGKWFPMIISRSTWRLWVSNGGSARHCARQGAQIRYWHTRECTLLHLTVLPFCFLLLFHTFLGGRASQMWTSPSGKSPTCSSPTRTSLTTGIILSSKPSAPSKTTTWTSISARSLRRTCRGWMTENAWLVQGDEKFLGGF